MTMKRRPAESMVGARHPTRQPEPKLPGPSKKRQGGAQSWISSNAVPRTDF